MEIKHLIKLVAQSAVYCQPECESIRIDYYDTLDELVDDMTEDELSFYGTGEESGEQYQIAYADINLAEDMFYELKLVDIATL